MSARILILRPEPGASVTAGRARAAGLDPVAAPLFTIRPVDWDPPDPDDFDAVLLTSANAARHGGTRFIHLPCYTAGDASGAAARLAGYGDIRIGPSDGAAAAGLLAAAGAHHVLHLCGRDHVEVSAPGLSFERRLVYIAEPVRDLPEPARAALAQGALVLLHSAAAATLFGALAGERGALRIASISPAVAAAAGEGWAASAVAAAPRDEALLELAVQLCQTGSTGETGNGD